MKGRGLKNNDKRDFKPLYIPWYETEFQADRIVKRMTSRQRAFYRNVLMDCYFGNERPYLPTDDDELWLIADADTKQEWLDNKALIMTKFTEISRNGELLLSNKRVMEEWQIIEDFLAQKKKAGLASAAGRRRQNGATSVQQPVNDRPTNVQHPADSLLNGGQRLSTDKDVDVNEDVDSDVKEEERETEGPSLASSNTDRSEKLVELVVKTAIKTSRGSATFSGKAKTAIGRVITEMAPTEDDLTSLTDHFVKKMDDFQLKNAGSFIAENLGGWLAVLCEARAARKLNASGAAHSSFPTDQS